MGLASELAIIKSYTDFKKFIRINIVIIKKMTPLSSTLSHFGVESKKQTHRSRQCQQATSQKSMFATL